MSDTTQTDTQRCCRKLSTIRRSLVDAGSSTLDRLESETPPAIRERQTARSIVMQWTGRILSLQKKGYPLPRIFAELKKTTKIRIGYRSFQSYLSAAARKQGLREPRQPKTDYNCPDCKTKAVSRPVPGGATAYQCPECKTLYASDGQGRITPTIWQRPPIEQVIS